MAGTEADQGSTGANVLPVVVGVGDAELALVLARVAIAVADKRGLVVVVEVVADENISFSLEGELNELVFLLGNSDEVSAVAAVNKTIVVVLVLNEARRELVVVDPDVGASLFQDVSKIFTRATSMGGLTSMPTASPLSATTLESLRLRMMTFF